MRADWVYRGNKWLLEDPQVEEDTQSGTYYNVITHGVGQANANGGVLYDSSNFVGGRYGTSIVVATGLYERMNVGSAARPDSPTRGALIHGVDVGVYVFHQASSWTTSAVSYLGIRIVVAKQDTVTGQMLLAPEYTMWQNVGTTQESDPAMFANGRQNCWEKRTFISRRTEDTNGEYFVTGKPRFKRRLDEDEGLFLYTEFHPNSVAPTFVNFWCRTLVSDAGRT